VDFQVSDYDLSGLSCGEWSFEWPIDHEDCRMTWNHTGFLR